MNRRGFLKASAALITAPAVPTLPTSAPWWHGWEASLVFCDPRVVLPSGPLLIDELTQATPGDPAKHRKRRRCDGTQAR